MTVINSSGGFRQINQAGKKLIEEFEGLRLTAYWSVNF